VAKETATEIEPSTKPAGAVRRLNLATFIETVPIPAGMFMMGNDSGKGDEKPRHEVRLDAFNMSRTEITNRQYLTFLEETGYPRPRNPRFAENYLMGYPDLPVVNVSYEDAIAFCAWASAKFDATVRLPTEAEWEYAADGKEGMPYPWGTQDPKTMARFRGNVAPEVATVKRDAFPPNHLGLYNMSGNVWEWVSDFYSKDYYKTSPIRNPAGPRTGTKRSVRGGSWADDETALSTTRRANRAPGLRSDQIGFRIVMSRSKGHPSS
jgi:formylglycine-generating enzyme required for sulfatase activity